MIALHFTDAQIANMNDDVQRVGCALLTLAEFNPTGMVPESIRAIPAITELTRTEVTNILDAFEHRGWITRGEPYSPTQKTDDHWFTWSAAYLTKDNDSEK